MDTNNTPIWHPFTQMKTAGKPIQIAKGKGAKIYDTEGNEYIDAISSWWVNLHGHAHPYIAQKVFEQLNTLEHVIFAGFTHRPAIQLCERLLAYVPHMSKVFFSDNGSTAVEVAMKMCIQYFHNKGQQKTTVIALEHAYHGDTFGAMSAGGDDGFNDPFKPLMFDVERLPTPTLANKEKAIQRLQHIITEKEVGCFIFEPLVQGAGGMIMYDADVLDELISICKANDVLCIADEVMTGFYRTGKMFATDYLQQKPDVMAVSKGLTGGTLPLSLTICSQKIYDAFLSDDKMKTFFHGHSFTGNPIGCAASLASLDLLEQEDTQQNIQRIINSHQAFKTKIQANTRVAKVRQQGTILAIEFKTESHTSYFNNLRDTLYNFFLDKGILLRPLGNVIYILPPYCITQEELQTIYDSIEEVIEGVVFAMR